MGIISPELQAFKNKMSSAAIGGMSDAGSTITNGLQSLTTSAGSVQSSIDSNYKSANKSTILSNLGRVSEIYSKIASSIESDLTSLLSGAQAVVDQVQELEDINTNISNLQSEAASIQGDDENATSTRAQKYDQITTLSKLFDTKHEAAKAALSALKSQDGSIAFVQEFSINDYENVKDSLEYGTFELKQFTSSNGSTIEYYIYVPDYGTDVENLPCMLYLHGSTSSYSDPGWSKYGLTGLIKDQDVTPSGIVIMPHIKDHKDTQTLKELTDYVVSEYNCDTNKISISGHSSGAIATYRMINTYPNYFSCAVPISGCNYGSITEEAFGGMNVWAFGGSEEGGDGATSTSVGQGAIRNVNRVGGNGKFTVLGCGHAATDEKTFEKEYESPDGTKKTVIEWMFEQEKA